MPTLVDETQLRTILLVYIELAVEAGEVVLGSSSGAGVPGSQATVDIIASPST